MMRYYTMSVIINLALVFSFASLTAQEKPNPIVYPYGGEIDSSRRATLTKAPPLNFKKSVNFNGVYFPKGVPSNTASADSVDFTSARFESNASFSGAQSDETVLLNRARFIGYADFSKSQFDTSAEFQFTQFDSGVSFNQAIFRKQPDFEGTTIRRYLDLRGTQFLGGVDLRRADLDSVSVIYIDDHTSFPDGEFWVRWDQIGGRLRLHLEHADSCIIYPFLLASMQKLTETEKDSIRKIDYRNLETFYLRLRDNYIAQRDNSSADDVMYELAGEKGKYIGGFWWTIYGWLFGWGYQPWRFLVLLVLPLILIFTCIWYWFYFELVIRLIDDKIEEEFSSNADKPSFGTRDVRLGRLSKIVPRLKSLRVYIPSDPSSGLGLLSRSWHIVFFSASVLLGIRFKKQWFQKIQSRNRPGEKWFLRMITLEWLTGIALYITFTLFVKGTWFQFIKGLFGI